MTLEELATLPLWKLLPAGVRKVLDAAAAEGWELHGKGATIAFRLDRDQDELDLPLYVMWQIGKTPKGAISFAGGKGAVPHATLSTADVLEYVQDPTTVYPLEAEPTPDEPESHVDETEDTPPWDTAKSDVENLSASLKATLVSDKPAPKPLRFPRAADSKPFGPLAGRPFPASPVPSSSPASSPTSEPSVRNLAADLKASLQAGIRSSARSTGTVKPLRVSTPQASASGATRAGSPETSTT